MNTDVPFTAHGDEAIEARIVAWVLGEASAFEAAELGRLCEERPELMVFKRRMAALHGLLAEAENAKPDDSWKLPPGKRKTVEEILGGEQPIRLEAEKEQRIRRSGRRALLAIAACLALAFVTMYFQPWKKTSEAIIEVKPAYRGMSPLGGGMAESSGADGMSPQFFATEFEKIKSRNTLEQVVDNLDLDERWEMDKEQAVEKLKDSIKTTNVRGTDLVKIQVRQSDKKDADEIAREVAFAYKDYRGQLEKQNAERQLAELNKAVRDQEDKVEERRKVLATIERTRNAQEGGELAANDSRENAIKRGLDAQDYVDAKREFETDQQLLQQMKLKQMGESISRKVPSDSVVVHEVPGPEAESADRASGTLASNTAGRTQRLRTDLPAELIEGTPQPINLPNLDAPADGPAGSETWSLASRGESEEFKKESFPEIASKPSRPASARSEVLAANTASGPAIPEPDGEIAMPSLAFGDRPELGTGRGGGGSGGGIDFDSRRAAKESAAIPVPGGTMTHRESDADVATDPFAEANGSFADVETRHAGSAEIDVIREFSYSTEYEPPQLPGQAGGVAFPVTPATPAEMGLVDGMAPVRSNPAMTLEGLSDSSGAVNEKLGDDYWDTSKLADANTGKEKEFDIHAGYQNEYRFRGRELAKDDALLPDDPEALARAVRDQEDKLEERRKVLSTIVRTKGIAYKEVEALNDESRGEAIKDGLDAHGYVDAKREFEKDQELLQQMKLKLMRAKAEAPEPDLTQLMEEIAASEDPYSTFSLNISDASFRIAQAALAKGEQPDPAGIKVEQFYNAVDYGDPAPAAGEPVSCEIEQAAHPVIPGRNLVRIALKTAAAGRSAAQPLRLTLLVDQSGSMTRADRRAAMDAALAGLGKLLTDQDLVNVVGFSRSSHLLADGMQGDEAGKKLADLVNLSASEGGTNLESAIDLAGKMAQRRMLDGAQNRIVLFTDGAANLGDADPRRLAAKVEQLRQLGIAFDIAGIAADNLNDELLGELARKGNGRYYVVGNGGDDHFAKQLAGAFRPAAENVKVQVRFNPERVGRYKLIGFEKDRLKTEDFRNDKVDAAEMAAEEAGVAIYQVEPLPGGNGELGEVSVRFRDTAAGEMVERTWTIPHDAAAPAIDRATPSMQLAVLATFAAEKLKGGPLAEAIDFRRLAGAQANVKRFFGHDSRVAEMLRMVEMLK